MSFCSGIYLHNVHIILGHFRVAASLCFKARLRVKLLIWTNEIIAWFVRDICHKYHSRYFKIVSKFTRLTAREITYNNFEISLVVFMPNITTNHAITYTSIIHYITRKVLHLACSGKWGFFGTRKWPIRQIKDTILSALTHVQSWLISYVTLWAIWRRSWSLTKHPDCSRNYGDSDLQGCNTKQEGLSITKQSRDRRLYWKF